MFALLLALFWPLMQAQPIVTELGTRWFPGPTIDSGLKSVASVVICPSDSAGTGDLLIIDSTGQIVELARVNHEWSTVRTLSVGEPVTTACAANLRVEPEWSLVVGTKSGKIIEYRRGMMGWAREEITTRKGPLRMLKATEPGRPGPAQLFDIDADGVVTNHYIAVSGKWVRLTLPPTDGSATHICFDYGREALTGITAGPKGIIYKFDQDTMGAWSGGPWSTMSAGCLDLAEATDPTRRDISLYYSGLDGSFRYLFAGRTADSIARLPVADGVVQMIGRGDQRRHGEFFGMSGQDFCLYEYSTNLRDWEKIPIGYVPGTVVSTAFGPGRGGTWHSIFVATVDGKVHEYLRQGLEMD